MYAYKCVCAQPLLGTLHPCNQGEGGWEAASPAYWELLGRGWHSSWDRDVRAHKLSKGGREEAAILPGSHRMQTSIFPEWEREGSPRLDGRRVELCLSAHIPCIPLCPTAL